MIVFVAIMKAAYNLIPQSYEHILYTIGEPTVQPMRYTDIPRAVRAMTAASTHDPMHLYLDDAPDAGMSHLRQILRRVKMGTRLAIEIYSGRSFTVERGAATVQMRPPGSDGRTRKILLAMWARLPMRKSVEQNRRGEELNKKVEDAIEEAFGNRIEHMYAVESLATDPKMQGRGYGTALVATVTDKADAQWLDTWLISSNVANTGFYEHCGFQTVSTFTLGDGNPTWTKPPVVVTIMIREFRPQTRREKV